MKWIVLFLAACVATPVVAQDDPAIARAQAMIASKMKDPDSAKFRAVVHKPKDDGSAGTVCGWVNAKNSYGAYVGFKPFYSAGDSALLTEVRDDDGREFNNHGMFAMIWPKCMDVPKEKFGDVALTLPKLKVERECAKRRKQSADKPHLYQNCEADEAESFDWLAAHRTSHSVAYQCEREIRRYASYRMGQSCVKAQELAIVFRRGPGPEAIQP